MVLTETSKMHRNREPPKKDKAGCFFLLFLPFPPMSRVPFTSLGPPVVPFDPFSGEGSPARIDYIKKGKKQHGYPESNLSTGGPSLQELPPWQGRKATELGEVLAKLPAERR